MEVTYESHISEITEVRERTGHSTGVILRIGTWKARNSGRQIGN